MRARSRGVSLIEAVFTLGLFVVVLLAVGSLLTDATRLLRRGDQLSWANKASDWINQMEIDLASASQVSLSPGASDTRLALTVRDVDSPDFLPETPLPGWDLDSPSLQVSIVYAISSGHLQLNTTPATGTASTAILGEVDNLDVKRTSSGNFVISLRRGEETLRREVPALSVDSQAAPL